jgi:hypothetical protein
VEVKGWPLGVGYKCVSCFLDAIVKKPVVSSPRDDDSGLDRHTQAFIDFGLGSVEYQLQRCDLGIAAEARQQLQRVLALDGRRLSRPTMRSTRLSVNPLALIPSRSQVQA